MAPITEDSSGNVVRAELEKILSSEPFAQSESLKRFLRHIVEAKLSGKEEGLKELALGADVFERGSSYDPRLDPIVRVQATRLRGKLRDYYAAEGADAGLVIELPRGTYVPEFSKRELPAPRPAQEVRPRRAPFVAGVGVLAIAILLSIFQPWNGGGPPLEPSELSSILVLPFADMSPEGDHQHWGDGIAEEITTTLAGRSGLDVVPRTTAFRYKGSALDLSAIAAELSVDAVLQGSVRRSGDALRVQVQLIRAADGRQIWSQTYDREAAAAFEVQEEIARAVVKAVSRNLTTEGDRGERFIPSAGAYEDYLRGRFEQERNTPASLVRSVASFEAALEKDADFAPAYAGLVESHVLGVLWGFVSPAETRELSREAAERALELRGDHPEALSVAALYYLIYEWNFPRAEAILQKAPATGSGVSTARGLLLAVRGRLDEALVGVDEARKTSPDAPTLHQLGASLAFHNGDYDDAMSRCRAILDGAPDYPLAWHLLSRVQVELGRFDEAEASLERFDRKAEGTALALTSRSVLRAREGRQAEARELLSRLEKLSEDRYVPPAFTARARAALGDVDRALDDLERAVEERSFPLVFLESDPDYEPLRAHPRFRALVERLGLTR